MPPNHDGMRPRFTVTSCLTIAYAISRVSRLTAAVKHTHPFAALLCLAGQAARVTASDTRAVQPIRGDALADLDVRIVRLPPIRVASVQAEGEFPERDAWNRLRAWAEPKGLLGDVDKHPVFGFNNPSPSPERKEYGYEFWIGIGPDIETEGQTESKEFAGGLYAVTTCKLHEDPKGNVFEVWQKLLEWVQSSKYKWRRVHELEKPHDPLATEEDMVLDLYLPVEE